MFWGPVLKQDYAELWTDQNCETTYGEPGWITDQMICARASGKSTCNGDAGGHEH